jgi:hypothetical protein
MSMLSSLRSPSFGLRVVVWLLLSVLVIYFWWGFQKEYLWRIEREYVGTARPFWLYYFAIPALLNICAACMIGLISKQRPIQRSLVMLGLGIASPFIFTGLLLTVGCFVETVIFHMKGACL